MATNRRLLAILTMVVKAVHIESSAVHNPKIA